MQISDYLKKYWGYEQFRLSQDKIIEKVLNKEDVLALLPTGGGKSICFQIPSLIQQGITLVISPLISLMRDQVMELKEKKIQADLIISQQDDKEVQAILDKAIKGHLKLLYISPERLQSKNFIEIIKYIKLNFLAIDEAHCISEWGHDFRPSYLHLSALRDHFPSLPILALSASATYKVAKDIVEKLGLKKQQVIKVSYFRANLAYKVVHSYNKYKDLLSYLNKYKGPSIIYVRTRIKTKELSDFLNKEGFKSDYYHAGLSLKDREEKEKNWKGEKNPIIVATNAFGMGINKPNVSFICHWEIPDSIENYFQEVGRAGRDGKKALGVLFYNEKEIKRKKFLFEYSLLDKVLFEKIYKSLFDYYQIALHEKPSSSLLLNLDHFLGKYTYNKEKVLKMLQYLETQMQIRIIKKSIETIRILICEKNITQIKNNLAQLFLTLLIRTNPMIEKKQIEINLYEIAKKIQCSLKELKDMIDILVKKEIIYYQSYDYKLFFLTTRKDDLLKNLWSSYSLIQLEKEKKLNEFFFYIENKEHCRNKILLNYFGEDQIKDCKICDFCQPLT